MKFFLFIFSLLWLLSGACYGDTLKLDIVIEQPHLHEALQSAVILPEHLSDGGPLDQRWLRLYRKQLPQIVSDRLEPYGYFQATVQSILEQRAEGEYRLVLQVNAGEPVIITSLALNLSGPGQFFPQLQQTLNRFPLQVGDILRQDRYEKGKAQLIQDAINSGFLEAKFSEHKILVYRADKRAEIELQLDTGHRYQFGRTTFHGAGDYPERFLRRYLSYRQGDYFSHRKLGQTQMNMLNADLFQQVTIAPVTDQAEGNQMPVKIELQPAPRHRLRPGIGYGTDTGARVSLRYRDLNLFRNGHELKGDMLIAQKKQSLVTTYIIPDQDRLDSQTQLRLGIDREESDTYISRELFSEVEYQRAFGGSLLGSVFLRLTQEYSEIADEKTRSQMVLPGIRLQWRKIDNPARPSYGLHGNIEIKGAHSNLLSDTSLLQLTAQATSLLPLPKKFSLLIRLKGGTTWHNDPLRELPASLRFFAGGDRSVRGYRYQSLGPKDDTGQVVGGKHLLVANIELEKKFAKKWGGAVFYDIGNAFDSFDEYELEQGAGFGVRRYTQIGPIRLDLARQIGRSKNRWRIHVGMGFGW